MTGTGRRNGGAFPWGKILLAAGIAIVLLLGILMVRHYFYPREGTEEIHVVIEEGESCASIAEKLHSEGVVTSKLIFRFLAWIQGKADDFKAGHYLFRPGMHYGEVFALLEEGPNYQLKLVLPEGLTVRQTAERVEETVGIPADEFLAEAESGDFEVAFLPPENRNNLEGFLFPKTYRFEVDVDARTIIQRLLDQFQAEAADLDWSRANELGISPYQAIIVASLIEKEVIRDEERPLVAAVIYNRLSRGMLLQIDATVQYALPRWKERLTYEDLETPSPYNTYLHPGLPPAPICSPGKKSMEAALYPADVDYLYYVATGDGGHFFTADYQEFLRVKEEVQGGEG